MTVSFDQFEELCTRDHPRYSTLVFAERVLPYYLLSKSNFGILWMWFWNSWPGIKQFDLPPQQLGITAVAKTKNDQLWAIAAKTKLNDKQLTWPDIHSLYALDSAFASVDFDRLVIFTNVPKTRISQLVLDIVRNHGRTLLVTRDELSLASWPEDIQVIDDWLKQMSKPEATAEKQ